MVMMTNETYFSCTDDSKSRCAKATCPLLFLGMVLMVNHRWMFFRARHVLFLPS